MRKNTLAVLTALSAEPDKALHGLEIYERTGLLPGTTYPILLRSENAGWVCSSWADRDPTHPWQPRRRYYRITDRGIGAARRSAAGSGDVLGFACRWLGWALRPIFRSAVTEAVTK
ncbi:PadR family transcriptional regulator [Prauserella flavalba]|uniref:PadR family transcriptional regulator n=1 Tax=Prauserella flavalba TaxID=1477506 RepID=UPI000D75D7CB|nr:helix-turn-helix transcriptional regulator [Prauserella flavalba]